MEEIKEFVIHKGQMETLKHLLKNIQPGTVIPMRTAGELYFFNVAALQSTSCKEDSLEKTVTDLVDAYETLRERTGAIGITNTTQGDLQIQYHSANREHFDVIDAEASSCITQTNGMRFKHSIKFAYGCRHVLVEVM